PQFLGTEESALTQVLQKRLPVHVLGWGHGFWPAHPTRSGYPVARKTQEYTLRRETRVVESHKTTTRWLQVGGAGGGAVCSGACLQSSLHIVRRIAASNRSRRFQEARYRWRPPGGRHRPALPTPGCSSPPAAAHFAQPSRRTERRRPAIFAPSRAKKGR